MPYLPPNQQRHSAEGINQQLMKWKKVKSKNGCARSIGKQSGESVESVPKKKRKATVGRIAEKEGFKPGMKE